MDFTKIPSKRKSTAVAEQLIEKIKSGEFKSGDKLPSEREISQQMGVGRSSIREAVSALRILGIVETKAGEGSYIATTNENLNLTSELSEIFEKCESPYEILVARQTIEPSVAELAIERANSERIEKLKTVLEKMTEAAYKMDHTKYLELHKEFHLSIAKATRNSGIEAVVFTLLDFMEQDLWHGVEYDYLVPNTKKGVIRDLEIHSKIFEAIEKRDKPLCRKRFKKHFDDLLP